MTGRFGDLAAGDGYLGEIVDLPSGMVGLALFNKHSGGADQQRRIVYVAAEAVSVVKLEQDRPRSPGQRASDWQQLAEAHARQQSAARWSR